MVVIIHNGKKKLFYGHIARKLKLTIIFEGTMEDCISVIDLSNQIDNREKSELWERIKQRQKSIKLINKNINLCKSEININPKSALSVFVIDMEARKSRYEKSLKNLMKKYNENII